MGDGGDLGEPGDVSERATGDLRWSDGLMEAGLGDRETAAIMGWPSRVVRMIEVEAALGRALATTGLIPQTAGDAITRACDPRRVDIERLAEVASTAPSPVIPLVAALTDASDGGVEDVAAAWLHHGATSQDIVDTAVVLQVRDALVRLDHRLIVVADRCADLANQHRHTLMAGRTLGQQAVPVTFGLKAARWLGMLDRRIEQLRWVRARTTTIQLGGSAGTLAVYGDRGLAVAEALAEGLALGVPDLPWHAERDRIVELAGMLAGVVTTVGSMASELVLLAQSEIGEVTEGSGTGPGSSAMPHKRNPVHATAVRSASRLALGELGVLIGSGGEHEHERAAGAWQAEWVALPSALVRTVGAVTRLQAALAGLEIDAQRATDNLDRQHGLTGSEALASALTPALGRPRAHRVTGRVARRAATEARSLRSVAGDDAEVTAVLDAAALEAVLAPATSLQMASPLIDRALATHDRVRSSQATP
jgi:3-carboxy-cis,cis-muconate cycloisomerase